MDREYLRCPRLLRSWLLTTERSQLDVALPLPYLRHVRLQPLDVLDDEAAELDQRLVVHRVIEEQVRLDSLDRNQRFISRRCPEGRIEVDHRSERAGPGEEPV